MTTPNLTEEDYAELAALLRQAIDAEPYRRSPRIKRLRDLLAKLEPPSAAPERLPAPRTVERNHWLGRKKSRRR